jgi:hypothetical protein
MTRLAEAVEALGLEGELSLSGSWVRLRTEQCTIYVVEAVAGTRYYTWCDAPDERHVELFHDPIEAIHAGMRRASRQKDTES